MSKDDKTKQDNTPKQGSTKSVEREERKTDCLKQLKAQIDTFPIRIGDYAKVYASYFSTCPYCRKLQFNWSEISQELLDRDSDCPQWHCQKYTTCPENYKCPPPLLSADMQTKYLKRTEKQDCNLVELINSSEKVLVSPERLRERRNECDLTLQEVASRYWVKNRQNISYYEQIPEENCTQKKSKSKNSVASRHQMRFMQYCECYFLATIYKTTPGYLMGQIDDPNCDIHVEKIYYYEKRDGLQFPSDLGNNLEPDFVEFVVYPSLRTTIYYDSDKKRIGRMAYEIVTDKLKKDEKKTEKDKKLLSALEKCMDIYNSSIRKDIISDVRRFFDGFLDDTIRWE